MLGGNSNLIFNAAVDLMIFGKRLFLATAFNLRDAIGSLKSGADKATEWYKDKVNNKGATDTEKNYYDNPNPYADFDMSGTIQYNTIKYNTIQYNTIQYNTIQYNTIQCNAMQCNAMQCSAVQCSAMQCNAVQYNTIQYNTVQYNIQYNTTQHNTTQHNTTQLTQHN